MIHICYNFDVNRWKYAVISMISVIENNKDVQICFHNFISANLDEKIIKTIENKIASKLVTIKFYKISKYNIKQQSYITSAGFYRLYAPNLLPHLKRVLYLDDDIICLGDITELCNMKFQPQEWLKAVRDTKHWILWIFHRKYFKNLIERNKLQNSYFNSGMMLMNLEALRKADMQAKWENLIDNPLPFSLFNDQDILNYTCAGHVQLLDLKWNYFSFLKHASDVSPVLLHYAGPRKPWKSVKVKQYSYWKKYADLSGLIDKTK